MHIQVKKIQAKKENIFWCEEKVQGFKDYFTSVEFRDHVERATGMMDDCINASIEIFTQALAAGCMLKTVKVRTGTQNRSSWFDAEDHKKKKDVRKCLRCFRKIPEILTILLFTKASKQMFAAKEETRRTKLSCGQFTGYHEQLKGVLGTNSQVQAQNINKQEEWVDHFDKVFNENTTAQTENEEIYVNPGNDEESYDEILDTDISELEVEKGCSTPQKW